MKKLILTIFIFFFGSQIGSSQTLCNNSSVLYKNGYDFIVLDTLENKAVYEYQSTYLDHYFYVIDTLLLSNNQNNMYSGRRYSIVIINDSTELIDNQNPDKVFYTQKNIFSKKKYYKKYLLRCSHSEIDNYKRIKNRLTTVNLQFEKDNYQILTSFSTDIKKQGQIQKWENEHELLCYEEYCRQLIAFETEYVNKVKQRNANKLIEKNIIKTKKQNGNK